MDIITTSKIEKWTGDDSDFCIVKLFSIMKQDYISFSFNMHYLFEWVEDEDKIHFLQETFGDMVKREGYGEWSWGKDMDFLSIIDEMKKLFISTKK